MAIKATGVKTSGVISLVIQDSDVANDKTTNISSATMCFFCSTFLKIIFKTSQLTINACAKAAIQRLAPLKLKTLRNNPYTSGRSSGLYNINPELMYVPSSELTKG